ncbi:hypothetical protein AgCh_005312 [Apium graveolens]
MKLVCKLVQVFDDAAAVDETVQTLKRRKITEESKTTSDTAQVVQNEEQQAIEETANRDQVIKTSTSDSAQVDLNKLTFTDKRKLLWKIVKAYMRRGTTRESLLFPPLQLAVEESKSFRERSMTLVMVPNKVVTVQKPLESLKKKEISANKVSVAV